MNDRQVQAAIQDLESRLRQDDPEMVRRFHCAVRDELVATIGVMLFLTVGAVLLTAGIATASPIAWIGGIVALFASMAVDAHHRRKTT